MNEIGKILKMEWMEWKEWISWNGREWKEGTGSWR